MNGQLHQGWQGASASLVHLLWLSRWEPTGSPMVGVGDVVTMGVGAPGHPFSCGPACKYASKGRLFFWYQELGGWGVGGVTTYIRPSVFFGVVPKRG